MSRWYSRIIVGCMMLVLASCGRDTSDPEPGDPFQPVPAFDEDEMAVADMLRALTRDLSAVRESPMSEAQRGQLEAAEIRVHRAIEHVRDVHGRGATRGVVMGRLTGLSAVLLADDATAVGVADNGLLVLCGIAAVVTMLATQPGADDRELDAAWDELHGALVVLGQVVESVTVAKCSGTASLAVQAGSPDLPASEQTSSNTEAQASSTTSYRYLNQKCPDSELDRLQNAMTAACKTKGDDNTCSSSSRSKKRLARLRCSEVLRRHAKHEACLAARVEVQERCFTYTDAGHAKIIQETRDAVGYCRALAALQCAPGSPYNDR